MAFAAATEESRPVLTGVEVKLKGDGFAMAAADGFRLAVFKGNTLGPVATETSVIIPAKTLDDGEAATLASALELGGTAVIDERKALRICSSRFAGLITASSLDLLTRTVRDNAGTGIQAAGAVTVSGNTVYGHLAGSGYGINARPI